MSSRNLTIAVTSIVVIFFVAYFAFLWSYSQNDNDLHLLLGQVDAEVAADNWQGALSTYTKIHDTWHSIHPLVRINYAEEDFSLFESSLHRLAAGIKYQDEVVVAEEVNVLQNLWANFLRIVPKP